MATHDAPKLTPPVSDRDHVLGPDDAPVMLVEFGDYECAHCRQVGSVIDELRQEFGDRLRYVYRHFPIRSRHPRAQLAAEAAEAAGAQGKFWEMHELLFRHQGSLDRAHLVQYASTLELDMERFERELADHTHAERVDRNFESAVRSSAKGTPAFYLNGVRYDGAWDLDSLRAEIEKPLGVRVRRMFQQFSSIQASGGILLLAATILALFWSNSPWAQSYTGLWETHLAVMLGDVGLSETLLHWVNDGLMVIFFFVVGLEIKREVLVGELATPRRAALPLVAALGGMILPALIYIGFNWGGPAEAGWGIPMATDIAFVLGILAVFGSRVPLSLKVFFTALAIADDLGAVLIIALFYSGKIAWAALGVAAVVLVVLVVLNRGHVRSPLPYALLGVVLWLAFLQSGIHPTIAGVLLAMTIPSRTSGPRTAYVAQCTAALGGLGPDEPGHSGASPEAAAQTLETIAERIQSPLRRLERLLNPWVAYLIVPVFALANAGVSLSGDLLQELVRPISLGIILGLLLGKSLGIMLFSLLAVRIGIADLPEGVGWGQLFATSWLAGIGFTMSLFIANAAFERPALLSVAKMDILVASALAAIIGFALILLTSRRSEKVSSFAAEEVAARA